MKYNNLGRPFFKNYTWNFIFQDFTMNLKHSLKDQSTTASFTTLIEKIFLFFSFIYHVILKKPTKQIQHCTNVRIATEKRKFIFAWIWR